MKTDIVIAKTILDKLNTNKELQRDFITWVIHESRCTARKGVLFEDDYEDFHNIIERKYGFTDHDYVNMCTVDDQYKFERWFDQNIVNHPYRYHPTLQRLKHDFYLTDEEIGWIDDNRLPTEEQMDAAHKKWLEEEMKRMDYTIRKHPLNAITTKEQLLDRLHKLQKKSA